VPVVTDHRRGNERETDKMQGVTPDSSKHDTTDGRLREVPVLPPLDGRAPAWDPATLSARACPVCDAAGGAEIARRPDGLGVRLCDRCGTFFIDPAPGEQELDRFYSRYDACHRRAAPAVAGARPVRTYDPLAEVRMRELQSLVPLPGARVLDVGFGRGDFLLRVAALGASAEGIEPDPSAVESGRSLGLDVRLGAVTELGEDAPYDLVTLFDVVEHPLRPMDVLQHCARLTASGGHLAIWTPNGAAVRHDPRWVTFRVDLEHLQYFTADTCEYVAERLGLAVVHLETLGYPALAGIEKPSRARAGNDLAIVRRLKRSRAYAATWGWGERLRRAVRHQTDLREGDYHLFCVLRKQ
jgi:2-polyprenyl-3-methyl-5-hydroxy-6-metoxy-1,4-benzoquinol methylase